MASARLIRRRRTAIDAQPWPYTGRPRVLVEHPEPETCLALVAELRRRGCAVAVCSGPDAMTACPLHTLDSCVAVQGADVIVTALGFDREDARKVLRGLRVRYPSTPLVVETTIADALELEEELSGCTVVSEEAGPAQIADVAVGLLP